ncbi:IS5 family transposase [Streptomyces sp. NPDC001657]|uniref:IS5 family transposase n=1 Tax=Streptomyces sp. NPDC001657 TaxID=3154522 RepID=UPI00332BE1D7
MDDDLWALIEPLLPPWPERSPGPRPVPDRLCLQGILYVLHQNIAWQILPPELGFGSGQTCSRRLDRWQQARVFEQVAPHSARETERGRPARLVTSVCGWLARPRKKGGAATGPSPVDRRKTGSKHHLICDGKGTPLKVFTTAANVNDITQTLPLVDGIPPVAGRPGRPRRRPDACWATRRTTPGPCVTNYANAGSFR